MSQRDGDAEVYVMNADGSGQTQLTDNDDRRRTRPRSGRGTDRVHERARRAAGEIYVMNADGSGQTGLTNNAELATLQPAFSPDGKRIALTRDVDRDLRDERRRQRPGPRDVSMAIDPAFSPDGARIAFIRVDDEIYTINSNGTGLLGPADRGGLERAARLGLGRTRLPGSDGDDGVRRGERHVSASDGDDVVAAGAGTDTIKGLGGADTICGGDGIDTASYADHELRRRAEIGGGADDGSTEDGPIGARDAVGADVERLTGGFGDDTLLGELEAERAHRRLRRRHR